MTDADTLFVYLMVIREQDKVADGERLWIRKYMLPECYPLEDSWVNSVKLERSP